MYFAYNGVYDRAYNYEKPTYSAADVSYWERSLFQRMTARFKFEGLPEPGPNQTVWDKDSFLYGLFKIGYLACFKSKTYGIIFQPATPYGIGLFYQPTGMMINTPYFQFNRALWIGSECEVIKLSPDYMGIWDIITKYAQEFQYIDIAIRQSLLNARFAYAIAADNKKQAQSAQALMEKLANGDTAIIYDSEMVRDPQTKELRTPWVQFDRDLKQNFILPELVEVRRKLLSDFYKEIGVKIAPDKKERQITAEQEALDEESFNRTEVWNQTLQESIERYNRLFDQNMRVYYNDKPDGGDSNVTTNKQDSRSTQSDS